MDSMPVGDPALNGRRGRHSAASPEPAGAVAAAPATAGFPSKDLPLIAGGFTAVRELGRGADAVVWLATRDRDGAPFALKCLMAADVDRREAVRKELRLLSGIEHEHLVRIHDAVPAGFNDVDSVALVMDYAAGGSLGQLVAGRGRLTVGETVTILTPLAQALAFLHHRGSAHADVSPGNVLFTEHGKPLLSDLGLSRMVGDSAAGLEAGTPGFADPSPPLPGDSVQPGRDIYSLAALGWYCLTGAQPGAASRRPPLSIVVPDVPPSLAAALEAGLHEEVRERPTAAEFATAVFRCAAAEPVDLSASVHPTVVPALLTRKNPTGRQRFRGMSGRKRLGAGVPGVAGVFGPRPLGESTQPRVLVRAAAAAAVMAGLLLGGVAVASGWLQAGPDTSSRESGQGSDTQQANAGNQVAPGGQQGGAAAEAGVPKLAGAVPEEMLEQLGAEDPVQAVHALAALRSLALRTGSSDLLGRVNAPGSPAGAADARLGSELQAAGVVLSGFTTTVSRAEVLAGASADKATLRVESSTSAYEEHGPAGDVVGSGNAAGPQQLDLVLVRWDGAWRISEILAPAQ